MSMRQSRDELIKRGVLKEIFEKGEPASSSLRQQGGAGKKGSLAHCSKFKVSQCSVIHCLINSPPREVGCLGFWRGASGGLVFLYRNFVGIFQGFDRD